LEVLKMNENNQTQGQKVNQAAIEAAEAKTVINGKVVPISQAQTAMETAEANVTKTGIQQAHDNSSEPVQAGQEAQNASSQSATQAQVNVKQANVQSGQTELETHMNQAGQQQTQQTQQQQASRINVTQTQNAQGQAQGQSQQTQAQTKAVNVKAKNQAGE
jgi:hypothetical protein